MPIMIAEKVKVQANEAVAPNAPAAPPFYKLSTDLWRYVKK